MILVLLAVPVLSRASVAGGGCVTLKSTEASGARVTDWITEINALASARLPDEVNLVRNRVHGVVWRLDDFHVDVLRQQQRAIAAAPISPGWPSEATRQGVDGIHQRCVDLEPEGPLAWSGCHVNSSRCFQPAGVAENYMEGPYKSTPDGINSLEDQYTESLQRTGMNTPPCCVHHLLEMMFVIHQLLEKASSLIGSRVPWQIGSGTLISAFRVGRILPWEFDADIYIRMPERTYLSTVKQTTKNLDDSQIDDLYVWLMRSLKTMGYVVRTHATEYWQVEYSSSNAIYVDIVWPKPHIFDGMYSGRLPVKTVELHGYQFPYNMDLAFEYGEGWVFPNRGGECKGRCSTLDERNARIRCACICAREPARAVDAQWHLQNWRLEQYHNTSAAVLARAAVAEAAARPTEPLVCQTLPSADSHSNSLDALLLNLSREAPKFLELVKTLQKNTTLLTCLDFQDYCFGWFGDLVRSGCPEVCDVPKFVDKRGSVLNSALDAMRENSGWFAYLMVPMLLLNLFTRSQQSKVKSKRS